MRAVHNFICAAAISLVTLARTTVANSIGSLQSIKYGAFTQTATYSIADQLGFFTAYGLNVTYLQVPSSTFGYAQLQNGGYDILTGTVDNAVNLRFNTNRSVTVVGQLDQGPEIAIASVANITTIAQLRGKSLLVDSASSGFAFALRKVLSLYGLNLEDRDYSFQVVGSTNIRYTDLVAGQLPNRTAVYATILTYPFTGQAASVPAARRPNILARLSDFVQPFTSTAFTVREAALDDTTQRSLIRAFVAATYAANRFLADPARKNCSITAIAKQLNVSIAVAGSAYKSAVDPLTGETSSPGRNFTVNRQGLLNVVDVRSQFGGFAQAPAGFNFVDAILPGKGKLIDYSVRDEALSVKRPYRPAGC